MSINTLRYSNSFSKQTNKIDQEELGKYLDLDLLKKVMPIQYITYLCCSVCFDSIIFDSVRFDSILARRYWNYSTIENQRCFNSD